MDNRSQACEWAWKGARIGAITLGLTGFFSGVVVCVSMKQPVPPLFVTELGVFIGGGLGALVGWLCINEASRYTFFGALGGLLCGAAAGLLTGPDSDLWTLLGFAVLGSFLGLQAAPRSKREDDGWRLHR